MQQQDAAFVRLIDAAREGNPDSLRKLYDQFAPLLLQQVRQDLDSTVRTILDSTDFTQSVWLDFFARVLTLHRFDDPEQLARFLRRMAHNLVLKAHRRYLKTPASDVRRRVPLDASEGRVRPALTAREPGPAEQAEKREAWDDYLRRLSPRARELVEALKRGDSILEITGKLGFSERTVRRLMRRCPPPG